MTHILGLSNAESRLLRNTKHHLLTHHVVWVVAELLRHVRLHAFARFKIFLSMRLLLNRLQILLVFLRHPPATDNLRLILLQCWLDLKALLQVEERRIFEATVAHEVVKLVSRLNDIQV